MIALASVKTFGAWRERRAVSPIAGILADGGRGLDIRQQAAEALGRIGGPKQLKQLYAMAAPDNPAADRYLAVRGLAAADIAEAAPVAAKLFGDDPGDAGPVALLAYFLRREGGAEALAGAMMEVKPHESVAAAATQYFRKTGLPPANLDQRFSLPSPASLSEALLAENMLALSMEVDRKGDPVHGEQIFRGPNTACMLCHGYGGAGPVIGPDLSGVGAAATTDYIVDSILRPNKAIAEHYETFSVLTKSGGIWLGALGFQNEEEIVVYDAALGETTIPRDQIKEMTPMPSPMPPNLADGLESRKDFIDLAHFVSRLGRPGPYASSDAPIIRKWRVYADERPAAQLDLKKIPEDALWLNAYSKVQGELPASDFARGKSAFVRGFVLVQKAGPVRLAINDAKGLRLWVDAGEVEDPSGPLELEKGRRVLTFLIDLAVRGDTGLRVELKSVPGAASRFQVERGQ